MNFFISINIYLVILAASFIMTTNLASAQNNFPSKLTFVYVRPIDSPRTQWHILIYTEALKRMGIKFKFKDVPARRASIYSNNKQVDGELGRVSTYNENWSNMIQIAEHNLHGKFIAYSTDPTISLNGWESLRNTHLRVEHLRGVKEPETRLSQVVPAKQLSSVNSIEQAVKKLFLERTDIIVGNEGTVATYLNSQMFQHTKQEIGQGKTIYEVGTMAEFYGHAWLHKDHADLAPKIAVILKEMKKEGLFEMYRTQVGIPPNELKW